MLLLLLAICITTSAIVAILRRDRLSMHFVALNLANTCMISGVVLYIAALGGTADENTLLLFFFRSWQRKLRSLPIVLDRLGYWVAISRLLVPYIALHLGLRSAMHPKLLRYRHLIDLASATPILALAIFYHPRLFRPFMKQHFTLLIKLLEPIYFLLLAYLFLAFLLLVLEYRSITLRFFRRNFRYILLSLGSSILLYLPFASKDPSQIYNFFISEYIQEGITSYIGPGLSRPNWILLITLALFGALASAWSMLRYTRVDYLESRRVLILHQKYNLADSGVSIFIHGTKNRLLSSAVLLKRLKQELEKESPDLSRLRQLSEELTHSNQGMIQHMDTLYRSMQSQRLRLEPLSMDWIVEAAKKQLLEKHPDAICELKVHCDRPCLVDRHSFPEALGNLLCNGYEAGLDFHGKASPVVLEVRPERLWTVFEVQDQGGGIRPEVEKHLYEPFTTSKNSNANWGLGLYSVRRIVHAHLGRIRFESEEGKGSRFYILLPRLDAQNKG